MRKLVIGICMASTLVAPAIAPASSPSGSRRASWEKTRASWYKGRRGACGPLRGHYAAHKTLPCHTKLRVTRGSHSITVEILDRGPYAKGRDLDLAKGAFEDLDSPSKGVVTVKWKKTGKRR
jgi:peptidoglycan lytic transglycosylase